MTVHVTRSDIGKIAKLLIDAGQRVAIIGDRAWQASQDFGYGPSAAVSGATMALDDPAPTPVTTRPTNLLNARLRATLGQASDNASDLINLLAVLVPTQPNSRVVECDSCGAPKPIDTKGARRSSTDEIVANGWCASCYRLDARLTTIDTDTHHNRFYARYCRWCGMYKAEHRREPPLEILRIRHTHGRRVSIGDLNKHCPHCKELAKVKAKAQPVCPKCPHCQTIASTDT